MKILRILSKKNRRIPTSKSCYLPKALYYFYNSDGSKTTKFRGYTDRYYPSQVHMIANLKYTSIIHKRDVDRIRYNLINPNKKTNKKSWQRHNLLNKKVQY